MDREDRVAMYRDYLTDEGFLPVVDEDGDVIFKCEGTTHVILVDDDDMFFRLVLPNFWAIEDETERAWVREAALHATAGTKVAKIFPVDDDTWGLIELFCSPPENFKAVFGRSLLALHAGVQKFANRMHELAS